MQVVLSKRKEISAHFLHPYRLLRLFTGGVGMPQSAPDRDPKMTLTPGTVTPTDAHLLDSIWLNLGPGPDPGVSFVSVSENLGLHWLRIQPQGRARYTKLYSLVDQSLDCGCIVPVDETAELKTANSKDRGHIIRTPRTEVDDRSRP
ncbi:hypothetical protein J6590_008493 [Homalodisca vitripennis]|nr:hypothetical protein J6590_008493 [Homalodisca vitripennis]